MKTFIASSHNKYSIWLYVILLLSAVLPALLAVRNMGISPDSMMYSLVAQEIISGNGVRLPVIYSLKDNYDFVSGSVPFVLQPPLFPALLALLGGITPQSFLAGQILNVTSHVAISIVTFLLMKKIYGNNGIALLTAILVSVSLPVLKLTHYLLSDISCIALTVAVIYFLTLSRHSDRNRFNKSLFAASICASAAILTRFAGISLLPVFFWQILILVKHKNLKLKHASALLTATLPLITTGAIFMSNYIISGSISGWDPPSTERPYLDAFTGTIKMIFLQFQLGEHLITLISIFVILCIVYIFLNSNARKEFSKYFNSGLDLVIVFMISHTVLISHVMAKSQTVFELRYISPLVPFLFILCVLVIVLIGEMIRRQGFSKLSLGVIILSLGIISFGNCYKTHLNSKNLFSRNPGHYRILNSPTYHWIKENYGKNVTITSNRPWHLGFFGGYSTIRLPHRRFNRNYRIPDNMESFLPDRMSNFGSRVLVMFDEADDEYEGSYISGLFNERKDDDNFILIRSFSDGVIYHLKERSSTNTP